MTDEGLFTKLWRTHSSDDKHVGSLIITKVVKTMEEMQISWSLKESCTVFVVVFVGKHNGPT